jgi:hypothetical protein
MYNIQSLSCWFYFVIPSTKADFVKWELMQRFMLCTLAPSFNNLARYTIVPRARGTRHLMHFPRTCWSWNCVRFCIISSRLRAVYTWMCPALSLIPYLLGVPDLHISYQVIRSDSCLHKLYIHIYTCIRSIISILTDPLLIQFEHIFKADGCAIRICL